MPLRARRERPHRCGAEKRDEITTLHVCSPSVQGLHLTTPLEKCRIVHHSKFEPLMSEKGQPRKSLSRPLMSAFTGCGRSATYSITSSAIASMPNIETERLGRLEVEMRR